MNLPAVLCPAAAIPTAAPGDRGEGACKGKTGIQNAATITFQNFFNKFRKKAGMTGTAQTEEKEFRNIYEMDVIVIPTNKPVIRKDLDDAFIRRKRKSSAR